MKLQNIFTGTLFALAAVSCSGGGGGGGDTDSAGTDSAATDGTTTSDCPSGSIGCLCGAGAFCESGLTCLSNRCVLDPAGVPGCGNGNLDPGEECDLGVSNDNAGLCKPDCTFQTCGDGQVGPGEACDDGNGVDTDECTNNCAAPSCGDGIKQATEDCDDANAVNNDGCLNSCIEAFCGDGIVQAGVEDCDDANLFEKDGCLNNCTFASLESCGNGVEDEGEVCFSGGKTLVVGVRPVAVGIGKFNADGVGDVAAISGDDAKLAGWSGVGGTTFLFSGFLGTAATTINHAAFLDMNGDGKTDMLSANNAGFDELSLMGGNPAQPSLMFQSPVGVSGLQSAPGVFVEPVNLDGDATEDALVVQANALTVVHGGNVATITNNSLPGGFTGASACMADINGDDTDEAVVIDTENARVLVMQNNGNGLFSEAFILPLPFKSRPRVCASGDLNGDGYDDLIVSDWNEVGCDYKADPDACPWDTVTVLPGKSGELTGFGGKLAHPVGQAPWDVHVVDMDGDGKLDVVTPNGASGDVSVLHGDGLGWFDRHDRFPTGSAGGDPAYLSFGELNNDGLPDLAITRPDNNAVVVLLSDP